MVLICTSNFMVPFYNIQECDSRYSHTKWYRRSCSVLFCSVHCSGDSVFRIYSDSGRAPPNLLIKKRYREKTLYEYFSSKNFLTILYKKEPRILMLSQRMRREVNYVMMKHLLHRITVSYELRCLYCYENDRSCI